MPHLKRKIRGMRGLDSQVKQEEPDHHFHVKQEIFVKQEEGDSPTELRTNSSDPSMDHSNSPAQRKPRKKPSKPAIGSRQGSKNIVKNYGRAMSSFAYSEISQPYLEALAEEEGVSIPDFHQWIQNNKENIDGIKRLRCLLIPTPKDSATIVAYKRTFQQLCLIFLKFFAVNWIYSGKLTHKQVHLNYRFKMLRRVKDPEVFTYLK